tara:strand:- start:36 stop:521 length:486 start_codon:yes stop_codon:yes gene_type:complete
MRGSTIIALASHFTKLAKPLKKSISPGNHLVADSVVIQVNGSVNRSEDEEYTPTTEIPILATLAIFIEKSGIVADNVSAMLLEAMQEAILHENGETGEATDATSTETITARLKDIERAMERVRELTAELPLKERAGKTTVKVNVSEARFASVESDGDREAA